MEVGILGPLEVEVDGRRVRLGPRLGALLAVLVLEAGRVVPSRRLVELLWGESAPEGAAGTLRSHVAHLRRVLEPERPAGAEPKLLVTEGAGEVAGYALRIGAEQVDAARFERLVAEGRAALAAGDARTAVERLSAGLGLWRGPALADVGDRPFAIREVARLEGLRRAAVQARAEADLVLGRHAELVGELEGLVADQPRDEGLRRLLALALYRSQRVEAAAGVCQQGLQLLHERGLDSALLQELQRDILRGAPELDWAAPSPPRPFQLPPDIGEFTGRERELALLRARLCAGEQPASAVVVSAVDGKPGVGKSALAVHLAHELAPRFADGVLYVNLRGAEPQRLAPVVALGGFLRAFGAADAQIPPDLDAAAASYRSLLATRRVLVVLDNAADAAQVRPLLPASPGCAVLVTSRAQLADLEGAVPLTLDLLSEPDAVVLLTRLVGRERVDADPASAATVVRQCGLLPLAVRIAGARLRARPAWPLAALVVRLTDRRRRLSELEVGDLAVRASFLLSYEALGPAAARTFRLLGLLDGPDVTAEVAAALTGRGLAEAEATVERLADAQLLETPTPGRYRFHDLLRLFAREQADAEEDEAARRAALGRALGWYLATAEQADALLAPTGLRRGDLGGSPFPDRRAALAWVEAERANLVAAARQAAAHAPAPLTSIAWQLNSALWRFFNLRKHWPDWQAVCEAAIQAAQGAGDRLAEARPRNILGIIRREQRRYDEAIADHQQSLTIYREAGDRHGEGKSLNNLGCVYSDQQRFDEAIAHYGQGLAIYREVGDRHGEGLALNNLGNAYRELRRYDEATAYHQRSLAIRREVGDRHGEGATLYSLGLVCREQQRFDEAIAYHQRSLAICRELGDRYMEGFNLWSLGCAVEAVRGSEAARAHWREALAILTRLGAPEADEVRALLRDTVPQPSNRHG